MVANCTSSVGPVVHPMLHWFLKLKNGCGEEDADIALGAVVKQYQTMVRKYFHNHLPVADVDDACSMCFEKVWGQRAKFDPVKGSPDQWMIMIAKNVRLEILRRNGRMTETTQLGELDVGDRQGPEDREDKIAFKQLLAAAGREGMLSTKEQAHVQLVIDGRDDPEIAEVFQEAEGTVRSRLTRIKKKFRKLLTLTRSQ